MYIVHSKPLSSVDGTLLPKVLICETRRRARFGVMCR
jgi:hypothetical protein